MLLTRCGQSAVLLTNEGGSENGSLTVRLSGRSSNRDGVGARVTVSWQDRTALQEIKAGSSYLSQGALELTFGLGDAESVTRVDVHWPSGVVDSLESVAAGTRLHIVEGQTARE